MVNSSNVFELDLVEDGSSVSGFPKQYGTGVAVAASTLLSTLISDIDGLADYAASADVTPGTNVQAAILPIVTGLDLSGGSGTIDYQEWATESDANLGEDNFEHEYLITSRNAKNSIYFAAPGNRPLLKYDNSGRDVYQAGMPKPDQAPDTNLSAGALTGTYKYKFFWKFIDEQDNIIEGPTSPEVEVNPSSQDLDVRVPSTNLDRDWEKNLYL